ncbi:MAG: DUF3786 domain-containing protein [Clostridiales bacterium]|nr:DUF3786 domain-containing protein [Clostridiales bacterium]
MSNYEKLVDQWRLKFLAMDKERLLQNIPGLARAGEYFTISHFSRLLGVHGETGHIVALGDGKPVSIYTKLNVYTLFGYVKPGARLLGDWLPFSDLKDASPFSAAFERMILRPLAATFSGNEEAFCRACEKLGGRRLPGSGAKYEIDAFQCIPVRFLFWDGDEEFPAQANILFDRSATDFIHVESVVTIASEGVYYLAEAAGLEIKNTPLFRP